MSQRGKIKRGEIYLADLDPTLGSEKGKERRVLIVSNDIGNSNPRCPVVIVLPITGEVTEKRKKMPMYVPVYPDQYNGQTKEALIDCGQIRVLDIDHRIGKFKGFIESKKLEEVNAAIETVLQLKVCPKCDSVLLPNKKHCVSCKYILVAVCKNCHTEISSEFKFCPHCGERGVVDG
ncbi:type II toxin-antitoxin system PemK/MazF family toxin [Virgibacillus salexigens]|uniref:type II toxin-antitoxin system PemK/MazF family toxin n=1 Tax=Virgibacillus salexigens TaxID=61016 RepID=UPI003081FD45